MGADTDTQDKKKVPFVSDLQWMQKSGFCYRVRMARGSAHLTQRMVADALGVSAAYVEDVESGRFMPSLRKAAQMAAIYGVSLDALVYGSVDDVAAAMARRSVDEVVAAMERRNVEA